MPIYTIGHSTKPFALFLEKLQKHHIELLVDVRSIPRSRFNPQYNIKALAGALEENDIQYIWKGENLGGKKENINYEAAIDELVALAKSGKRVCVMCSEGTFEKCHRHTMLEPSFNERGVETIHIIYK